MPRKSAAELANRSTGTAPSTLSLRRLTAEQAVEFDSIVHYMPRHWFGTESIGILAAYRSARLRMRRLIASRNRMPFSPIG